MSDGSGKNGANSNGGEGSSPSGSGGRGNQPAQPKPKPDPNVKPPAFELLTEGYDPQSRKKIHLQDKRNKKK